MIRIAIIGLGAAARNIHLPAYSKLRGKVRVVAGCDPDEGARASQSAKWGLPEVYEDPRAMIESTKPDVVSICTPPHLHHEQSSMALGYGCHVFCEKPLADDLQEVDDLIAKAEAADRLLVVNSEFPFMNIHASAKKLIGSPRFGRLLFLHASQTFRPTEATEAGWRQEMSRRLGLEFGVHVLDLVRFFFGEDPVRIFAHMPRGSTKARSDVINVISLEFSDGRGASIVLDRLSKGPERYLKMRLDGEFATIETSIGGEVRLEVGLHTRARRPYMRLGLAKGGTAVLQNGDRSTTIAREGINPFADATAVHFANMIEAIQNGGEPPGNARDNRRTLGLVFAAYDSAQSGEALDTDSYLTGAGDSVTNPPGRRQGEA
ncbi:MAG: Gfo/Idh/MocA family oxidoreductase [bacterium]|nr:Gfo/Idh/MocA family oxidoreductase [bacterium]